MSIFSITSIVIFFSSLGFALTVYSGNTKSKLNRSWLRASIAISAWGLCLYGVTSASNEETALFWQYLLDVAAIFIPVLYLYFILTFLELRYMYLRAISMCITVLLAIFSFSTLYKEGVTNEQLGFFWVNPGPFYFLFPALFLTLVLIASFFLARAYFQNRNNPTFRGQIRNQFLAGTIAFSGGITNFFPQFFETYPFGNYFVVLYVFFMSYAVLPYRFLGTKIVPAQLFPGAMVIIFLFNLLQATTLQEWILRFLPFVFMVFFSIALVRSVYKEVEAREKVEQLAGALEKANVRLQELDKLKSEFVSIASHQLRSPLTSIKGYASMVLEGSYGIIPEKAKEAISRIFESSKLMAISIEDFLNVSRIEQGKMQYDMTEFDLGKLVQTVVDELGGTAKERGLGLHVTDDGKSPYMIRADLGKIKQVINNLIDNAVKYTKQGSVDVMTHKSADGKTVQVSIKDTGVGMSKETIEKLFDKFVRAKNANEVNVTCTGLGLYVAKKMVEAHQGKIWVESSGEGRGSTFFVELPLISQQKVEQGTEDITLASLSKTVTL